MKARVLFHLVLPVLLPALVDTAFAESKAAKTDSIAQGVTAAVYIHPTTGAKSTPDSAIRKAFGEARRLYKDLDEKSSGELAQINKNAGKGLMKVSQPMLLLLRVCAQISEWTQGLFDVVRSSGKKAATLQVDFGRGEVQLLDKKSQVNFAEIRNGYVIDRMAGTLKSEGYSDFMIKMEGTPKGASDAVLRTMGRDGSDYWRLNVDDPNGGGKQLCRVSLEDSSVATADVRTSPQTKTDLRSVTVITRNATNASALARTALLAGRSRAIAIFNPLSAEGFGVIMEDQYGKIQTIGDVTAACFEE
jgi:thiamine biosynthesis lipoprotein ApbE